MFATPERRGRQAAQSRRTGARGRRLVAEGPVQRRQRHALVPVLLGGPDRHRPGQGHLLALRRPRGLPRGGRRAGRALGRLGRPAVRRRPHRRPEAPTGPATEAPPARAGGRRGVRAARSPSRSRARADPLSSPRPRRVGVTPRWPRRPPLGRRTVRTPTRPRRQRPSTRPAEPDTACDLACRGDTRGRARGPLPLGVKRREGAAPAPARGPASLRSRWLAACSNGPKLDAKLTDPGPVQEGGIPTGGPSSGQRFPRPPTTASTPAARPSASSPASRSWSTSGRPGARPASRRCRPSSRSTRTSRTRSPSSGSIRPTTGTTPRRSPPRPASPTTSSTTPPGASWRPRAAVSLPSTFFVDANGKVVAAKTGALDEAGLRSRLQELFNQ